MTNDSYIIIVRMPCWPSIISRSKLQMPTQIIGVMSTPPIGGTIFLVTAKKGSVGQAIKLNGKRLRFTSGYQVRTIRKINSKVINTRTEPRIQLATVIPVMGLISKILSFVKSAFHNFNRFTGAIEQDWQNFSGLIPSDGKS